MTIKRRNTGKGHSYWEDGQRIPGVTTITGKGMPKGKGLEEWPVRATIDYAIDHWDRLSRMPISERIRTLTRARYESSQPFKAKGTTIHQLAEKLIVGEEVQIPDQDTPEATEAFRGAVQACVRWMDEWDVQPLPGMVEATIVSRTHRYCGTLDLACTCIDPFDHDNRVTVLVDYLTGRSGVFDEKALQVTGYRHADAWVDGAGEEHPMPEFDYGCVLWLRPNGYDFVPVESGKEEHRTFLYAQQLMLFVEAGTELVGEPWPPPTTSTYTLVANDARTAPGR